MNTFEFHVDFEDFRTYEIYTNRFINTAKILDIVFTINPALYGDNSVYAKIKISGNIEDVNNFLQFAKNSLALIDKEIMEA